MILSSDLNEQWYEEDEGLYTNELEGNPIKPGETKLVTLVLKRDMTENNTGLISNIAELDEVSYEIEMDDEDGEIVDKTSQDSKRADLIIGVKTGEAIMYLSIMLICIVIIGTGIYFIKEKVL